MKYVIGIIIVVGLSLGAWQIYQYWGTVNEKPPQAVASSAPQVSGDQLSGLPRSLEESLQRAEQGGTAAMKEFLTAHASEIKDPRRAWIELDYVVLVGVSDAGEARRVFRKVQGRLTPGSPVYERMKQLAKTYE
jgi:hypothetical protein